MRVNVYAEELTDRIEIISKTIDGVAFTGLRFYLELPATKYIDAAGNYVAADPKDASLDPAGLVQFQGPFVHRPGDDDSSAVTIWGKRDFRKLLSKGLKALDDFYDSRRETPAKE